MGGSDTPNHGRAAPGRPVDHVSLPRPPRGRPTRSNNHGPRRTPDTARGLHARRAASQAAPVAPLPGRASASRLTRAARGPWAAPTRSPEKPVYYKAKAPLGAPA